MYLVGGAKLFENREDGRDLFKELREKGFRTPRSWDELAGIKSGKVFAVPYPVDTRFLLNVVTSLHVLH